jgi:hypothetical protein
MDFYRGFQEQAEIMPTTSLPRQIAQPSVGVEPTGLEPVPYCLPGNRSPN